jgi:hypothetical protein
LPTASSLVLGGIKVGSRLTITDSVLSADVQTTDISGKVDKNDAIIAGTATKISYDAKGLVTSGSAATQDDIGDGTTYKQYSATDKSKLSGIESSADVTDAGNVGSSINGALAKTSMADADKVAIIDTEATNTLKTLSWAYVKSILKTYFDALYNKYVHPNHSGDVTSVGDGAQTIAANAVTLAKMATQAAETVLVNATSGAAVPTALALNEETVLGRITGGHLVGLTPTQIRSLINVADGAKAASNTAYGSSWSGVIDVPPSKNVCYDQIELRAPKAYAVTTGSSAAWLATIANIPALYDGLAVTLRLGYISGATTTLNLNGLGAKKVFYGNTIAGGYFAAGNTYTFVYDSTKDSGNGAWTGIMSYDSNDVAFYLRLTGPMYAKSAIVSGNIIVGNANGHFHLKTGDAFDINMPILWAGSAIALNATGTNNWLIYNVAISVTQAITFTPYAPVFIQGTLVGTVFTPVSTTPITQTIPASADGYDYLYLGYAYSTTGLHLLPDHPVFKYVNGAFSPSSAITVSNAAYGAGWDGVENIAPSKNTIYDQMETRAPKANPTFTGTVDAANTEISGAVIEINKNGSGDRYAFIDFHGDDTLTDYALRIIRSNAGANASSAINHKGTGLFSINAEDAAVLALMTSNTVRLAIAAAGTVSLSAQPLFSAQVTSGGANCCGNGIANAYDLLSGSTPACTWTEITDRASNFSGGTFTAPVAGNYVLCGRLVISGITTDHNWFIGSLKTSNRDYVVMNDGYSSLQVLGAGGHNFSFICDMDANDTAYLRLAVNGTAKVIDISTSTFFMGYLLP